MPRRDPEAAREYQRQWRAAHPDYHRRWAKAHAATERARHRRWRTAHPDLVRAQHARWEREHRHSAPEAPALPPLHQGHDLLEHAKCIAGSRGSYRYFEHPYYDDFVGFAVLGLLEGKTALQIRREFLRQEINWRRHVVQVRDGFEPHDGRLIVQGDLEND